MDPDYAAMQKLHKKEVAAALQRSGTTELVDLNRAAVFEQLAPVPLSAG
jgi:hypothetical protein